MEMRTTPSATGSLYPFFITLCSAPRERSKLDKFSRDAVRDAGRLDRTVSSQSDNDSSDDDDVDDDDVGFTLTRSDESGATAEAGADLSVSGLSLFYLLSRYLVISVVFCNIFLTAAFCFIADRMGDGVKRCMAYEMCDTALETGHR